MGILALLIMLHFSKVSQINFSLHFVIFKNILIYTRDLIIRILTYEWKIIHYSSDRRVKRNHVCICLTTSELRRIWSLRQQRFAVVWFQLRNMLHLVLGDFCFNFQVWCLRRLKTSFERIWFLNKHSWLICYKVHLRLNFKSN